MCKRVLVTTLLTLGFALLMPQASAYALSFLVASNPVSGDSGFINNFDDADFDPSPFGRRRNGPIGSVSGGQWTFTDDGGYVDYDTTTDLDTGTTANVGDGTIKDWVLSMDVEMTVFNSGARLIGMGSVGDLATFRAQGSIHGYVWQNGGSELTFNTGAGSHNWLIHYKSASSNLDLYVDNVLVHGNVARQNGIGDGMWNRSRFAGSGTNGTWIVDNMMVTTEFFPAPIMVQVAQVTLEERVAVCFTSQVDTVYHLQYTTDLVSSNNWQNAGATITGDGNVLYLFDPAEKSGSTTSKLYRIVVQGVD